MELKKWGMNNQSDILQMAYQLAAMANYGTISENGYCSKNLCTMRHEFETLS